MWLQYFFILWCFDLQFELKKLLSENLILVKL